MKSTIGVGPSCLLKISFQDHQDGNLMNIGALPRRCRPFSHTESCGSENKKYFGEDTSRGKKTKGGRSGGIVVLG